MRFYAAAVYTFLYAPIALIVLFSFNAGRSGITFVCCSTEWYGRTFANSFVIEAMLNSLVIAGTSALLGSAMGTMAALALQQPSSWTRQGVFCQASTSSRSRCADCG